MQQAPRRNTRSRPKPLKRFGQHFLVDTHVLDAIVDRINPQPDEFFGELGAGDGALTLALAPHCARITCVEIDRRLAAQLRAATRHLNNVKLLVGDALTLDTKQVIRPGGRMVGNLPYNISVALIEKYLQRTNLMDMHFLVQKEIAQRLFAKPGDKNYGRLSLMRSWHADGDILFEVPPTAFRPPPQVQSSLIYLKAHGKGPALLQDRALNAFVAAAFNRKHRKLTNTLGAYACDDLLRDLKLADRRAIDLSADEIMQLFITLKKRNPEQ